MNPRFSLYLDGVRFLAAMVVLLSHFAYPRFSHGDYIFIRELNLGSDAVALFFVLSGLVIAFAAQSKDRDLASFGFSRATRVFSVAIPAVVLGLGLDALGARLAPVSYDGWWYNDAGFLEVVARGLSFTNELWLWSYRVGTNGPYWSLAYEVWFYALFGAAFYLKGAKRVWALALISVFIGPKMLLLLPVWLCGVWCWKRISAPQALPRAAALTLAIAPAVLYALALAAGAPHALLAATAGVFSATFVENALGFSDEFVWNLALGIGAACHFLGMAHLLRGAPAPRMDFGARAVRWLAGASFSIYLAHYPLLQFIDSVLPADMNKYLAQGALLSLTLALCLVFAHAFERPLPLWRKLARTGGDALISLVRARPNAPPAVRDA